MSTQKLHNHDVIGVSHDKKSDQINEEHLYDDTVFETSKKIKKENELTHADTGTRKEVIQQKNSSPGIIVEKKHKSILVQNRIVQSSRDNVTKSREIHRRLMIKRNHWKPNDQELSILKQNYDKNIFPSKEDKEDILKNLGDKFKSKIDLNQLSRWFQNERDRINNSELKSGSKNTYKKFAKEELDYLKTCFSENTYPKTEEMIQIGKKLGVSLSKIENWYKHNRRSLAKKGCFTLKTKKYFKKEEINYLIKMFELYPRPTKDQVTDMAKKLSCTESQIKNWYSNKRKKQKLLSRWKDVPIKPDEEIELPITMSKISTTIANNNVDNSINSIQLNQVFKQPIYSNPQPIQVNSIPDMDLRLQGQTLLKPIIQQPLPTNTNFVPAFQNMPVFIIPASPMNNGSMTINTNTINTNTIYENQIKKSSNSDKPRGNEDLNLNKNNNNMQTTNTTQFQSQSQNQFQTQTHNHYQTQTQTQFEPRHTTQTNWVTQTQTFPIQSNPVIIVANKPITNYSNPSYVNGNPSYMNGNLSYVIAQNGVPMQSLQPISGIIPYEQPPMQIQYLTSLYAPNSNNNIFSNYYPVVYQNNPNLQFQPVQQINGDVQGQIIPQQTQFQQMDLKAIPMLKSTPLRRFVMAPENLNDVNNENKGN